MQRVPKILRKVNEELYTPKLVSIGPLHHRKRKLRDMEMQKLRYLRDFCFRTGKSQTDLTSIIEENEDKIRHCYAETSELSSKEFINMILLDGIFIIELFLRTSGNAGDHEDDYILRKPWLREGIQHDLIVPENQLPFLVLEDLYTSVLGDSSSCDHRKEGKQIKEHVEELNKKDSSFLELSRHATKLEESGVEFREVEDRHILDIKFRKGKYCLKDCPFLNCSWIFNWLVCLERIQPVLELPALTVDDTTECLFRNLMALEQCHYPTQAYICNYILFSYVDLLVEKKVNFNQLGSDEEVATLVSKLGRQIVEVNSCYCELSQKLNGHYEHFWNRNMATLKRIYFRVIWRSTATVVGIIFVALNVWNIFPGRELLSL
ncbi:hypothetical protein CIPAW_13G028400 [Carya illinoinensis]|uniref:Uncharacterized protein n=1 Tax=Carya illinoinensis TaxID=32201 RepID=A0A8T1NNT0_CARIL|nr:hypothetical protein CIPAW_13G028400 [Carya illinoinensis]